MYTVKLVNAPFANLSMPSIALTQLKSMMDRELEGQASTEIVYLNQEFAKFLGLDLYQFLTNSPDSQNSGLGDWFFRQVAFPSLSNNANAYFLRYFPIRAAEIDKIKRRILETRRGLDQFLDSMIDKYELDQASLVGFTSMFMQNVASFALARKLKERSPKIITAMGGANCESPMGQVVVEHVEQLDFTFSGPALTSFPEFVRCCMNGKIDDCAEIRGVFSKKNCGTNSGPSAIGEELSIDVPVPLGYDSFIKTLEANFTKSEVEPTLLFETSRGCWWGQRAHCTFCGLNGESMAYRAMQPDLALKQFDSLFRFSNTVSRLEAVDNILPKNYLSEVLPHVKPPDNMTIFYEVKADLSEKEVETLAEANVKHIQPGIESLATSTLKLMKKGTSAFTNLVLLKNCLKYGITPMWNILVGFPGEQDEVYEKYLEDVPLLTHLPPPGGVFPVRFDRYSPYFVKADEYGLKLKPLDFYSFIYPINEEGLENMAYYFADTNIGAQYAQTVAKWIDKVREKVAGWNSPWQNPSKYVAPRLFLKQNGAGPHIYDSRSGEVLEYEIGEATKEMLLFLNQPRRADDLFKNLNGQLGGSVEAELESLKQRRLVFEEAGRYLSLVLDREPAVRLERRMVNA
jgi:ribosomal peptide maturation radical SAM protein 1